LGKTRTKRACLRVPALRIGLRARRRDDDRVGQEPPFWYATTQAAFCLTAAWALFAMYLRGTPVRAGEPPSAPARDPGLAWLAAAVAMWGVVALVLLLPLGGVARAVLRPLLSSANSACLLISASHLDYGPEILQAARAWRGWRIATAIVALGVALATVALWAALGPGSPLVILPDVVLSELTLLLYGFGLWRSFSKRGFAPLAALAVVAIVVQSAAQVPELAPDAFGDARWTLNLASKAMTLVAFLSIAMSWVHEVARRPARATTQLYFTGTQTGAQARRRWIVKIGDATLEMRATPHRDLLALAARRAVGESDGWIALPDLVGRLDDSRIRRVREDLRPAGLDAAIESNFQKCYRLALEPARVGFDLDALASDRELAAIVAPLRPPAAK
jgi:hypothetical protein